MRLFNVFIVSIFIAVICLTACKRDFLDPMGKQVEFTQKEIEIKWAEARSGRWYTYSHFKTLEQGKKERIDSVAYQTALFSFSENARDYYRGVFNEYFKDSIDQDVDVYLDSIYPVIYSEMDQRMADPKYMEQLFTEYTHIKLPSSYKRPNKGKLMASVIDETWVTRCHMPSGYYRNRDLFDHNLRTVDPMQKPWTFRCAAEAKKALDTWYDDFHRTNNGYNCGFNDIYMFTLEDNFYTCLFDNRDRDNPEGGYPDPIPPGGTPGGGGSTGGNGSSTYFSENEFNTLLENLKNDLNGDPIEFYLIAIHKNNKLLNSSTYSIGANSVRIGQYTLTPHYDSNSTLRFYTASRNTSLGIEYIVRANSISKFESNYTLYEAAANAFYINGIPTQSQIQIASGDFLDGLVNSWANAITDPAYYAYLTHVFYGISVNTAGISFQSTTIRNTDKISITIENYSSSQFRTLLQQKRGGVWQDYGSGKLRLVSGADEYFYYPKSSSMDLPSIQYTRNGNIVGIFRFDN